VCFNAPIFQLEPPAQLLVRRDLQIARVEEEMPSTPGRKRRADGSQSSFYILLVALGDIGGLHITAVNEYAHPAIERLTFGEREPLAVLLLGQR